MMPRVYRQSTANSALLVPTPSTRRYFPILYVIVHPRNHIHKIIWQIIVIATVGNLPVKDNPKPGTQSPENSFRILFNPFPGRRYFTGFAIR
jgi:hypothetical protein